LSLIHTSPPPFSLYFCSLPRKTFQGLISHLRDFLVRCVLLVLPLWFRDALFWPGCPLIGRLTPFLCLSHNLHPFIVFVASFALLGPLSPFSPPKLTRPTKAVFSSFGPVYIPPFAVFARVPSNLNGLLSSFLPPSSVGLLIRFLITFDVPWPSLSRLPIRKRPGSIAGQSLAFFPLSLPFLDTCFLFPFRLQIIAFTSGETPFQS